ncbi:MAG: SUMF1/EgtB/PvdO family nonheme iron enzyme [Bacteroidota bacterium]
MKFNKLITLSFLLFSVSFLFGNNIRVRNVELINQDEIDQTYQVKFNLSWENSWRTSTLESNWDAAWIFVKYREVPYARWNHATLRQSGFLESEESEISVPFDRKGAFIYRADDGIGDVNFRNLELKWDYGADNLNGNAVFEICVFAIEMVYVPEGPFLLGDGSRERGTFRRAGSNAAPYEINGEYAISLGGVSTSSLSNSDPQSMESPDDFDERMTKNLPSSYPTGFKGFYIMKYEATEEQYVDFLNKLTPNQRLNRYGDGLKSIISFDEHSGEPYSTRNRKRCIGNLSMYDVLAYLDWAALRPMSELEYEKACRGKLLSFPKEYAWGNNSIFADLYVLTEEGEGGGELSLDEDLPEKIGNASYSLTNPTNRPFSPGLFAAESINSTREETGGSYYGIMELSGNLAELTVSIGSAAGRAFIPIEGNGELNSSGNFSNSNSVWSFSNEVSGLGLRGGSYVDSKQFLQISDRIRANVNTPNVRLPYLGIRGVRSTIE